MNTITFSSLHRKPFFLDNKQINRPCRDRLNDSLCISGLLGVTDTDELLLRDINNNVRAFQISTYYTRNEGVTLSSMG